MIEKLRIEAVSVISTRSDALILEKLEGLLEPVLEFLFRTPSEHFGRARRRNYRSHLFARPRGPILRMSREISDRRESRKQVVHVGLDSGADVERNSRRGRFQRREDRADHVTNED